MRQRHPTKGISLGSTLSSLTWLLILSHVGLVGCSQHAEKTVALTFRYDDYCALTSLTFDKAVLDTFQRRGLPLTVGVIPFIVPNPRDPSPQAGLPLTREKLEILQREVDKGMLNVALHGYSHQLQSGGLAEFVGRPYDEQLTRILRGKAFLGRLLGSPPTFIPPWNGYDSATLRALGTAGFRILSADTAGPSETAGTLTFVPATTGLGNLRQTIRTVEASGSAAPLVVVLFHAYDFREQDPLRGIIDMPAFDLLLQWLQSRRSVKLMSFAELIADQRAPTQRAYATSARVAKLSSLLPPVARPYTKSYLDVTGGYGVIILLLTVIYGALLLAAATCAYLLQDHGTFFFRRYRARILGCLIGAAVIVSVYTALWRPLSWRCLSVSLAFSGASLGLVASRFRRGRARADF